MASVKLIFWKEKITSNGKVPFYIRIINNRKPTYIALGISVKTEDWMEKPLKVTPFGRWILTTPWPI
jgi:hypothetical protein